MTINNIPDFRVTLDGRDLTGAIRPRLVSLSISEKRGDEADQLDLVLDDSDGRLALPSTGAIVHVQLGWKMGSDVTVGLIDKGSFTVDEIEHGGPPDHVTIRGRSADFTSQLATRREKGWHATTLGAVVSEIAGRHKLTPKCADALAGVEVDSEAQSRESDIAFLRRLGREHDAVATIKRGALILKPIGSGATPSGKALPSLTLKRREGDAHSYHVERRDDAAGVTASYHDRKSATKEDVTIGDASNARRLSRTYATKDSAKRAAETAKSRAARQPVTLTLNLGLGRPALYPEQHATVSGYKAEIDAVAWLIAECTHTLTDRGLSTGLKLENVRAKPT